MHIGDIDNNEPIDLDEHQTEVYRRVQTLSRNVAILTEDIGDYKRTLRTRTQREEAKNGPIAVLDNLVSIFRNKDKANRHVVYLRLYNAIEILYRKRTIHSWRSTAKKAKGHGTKVDEIGDKLQTANGELTALLRAFVIAP